MSCEYCRGELPIYGSNSIDTDELGKDHIISYDTKIVHGFLMGVRINYDLRHAGGSCVAINYCPMCGERVGGVE